MMNRANLLCSQVTRYARCKPITCFTINSINAG